MSAPDPGDARRSDATVEAEGTSAGTAKWAAMKQLEQRFPGIEVEQVEFELLEERPAGPDAPEGYARVEARPDLEAWRAAEKEFTWPDEPTERVRAIVRRTIAYLGIRASVDVEESDEEVRANVSGPELGLLIGKHGQTIDSLQFVCSQAAFRGLEERKRVVIDAGGYRERREGMLQRQADRGVADALRYGRPVELDSMGAAERRVVHTYLADRPEVDTHSEGDEPFRRIVISPRDSH
jgi:spoIIIJ-associated protein